MTSSGTFPAARRFSYRRGTARAIMIAVLACAPALLFLVIGTPQVASIFGSLIFVAVLSGFGAQVHRERKEPSEFELVDAALFVRWRHATHRYDRDTIRVNENRPFAPFSPRAVEIVAGQTRFLVFSDLDGFDELIARLRSGDY